MIKPQLFKNGYHAPIAVVVENKSDRVVDKVNVFDIRECTIPENGFYWNKKSLENGEIKISSIMSTISYKNILLELDSNNYIITDIYITVSKQPDLLKSLQIWQFRIDGTMSMGPLTIIDPFECKVIYMNVRFLLSSKTKLTICELPPMSKVYFLHHPNHDGNLTNLQLINQLFTIT